ncbi:MAG: M3 family oligoendopeptidase [Nitrososphaerales archaeon]|nr:M3 family oligoendopeptidase [Nitrososphaerales archaeon]
MADKWNLSSVLDARTGQDFDKVKEQLEAEVKEFERLRPGLAQLDREGLMGALDAYSRMSELKQRLNSYSLMLFSEDTRNQEAKVLVDRASDMWAEVDNRALFFRLWWISLPDEKAADLRPPGGDYAFFLDSLRKLKPYTLEEKVEQVINLKNTTGAWQWAHHYDHLTSSFTFLLTVRGKPMKDEKGRPRRLVASEVARLFASPDSKMRVAAYDSLLAKYAENGSVLGDVYRTVVRDWKNESVKLRGYPSPIAARNTENDVPDASVRTLLEVCRKNIGAFQDFFALKARIMGWRKMSRYHIYAPLSRTEKRVGYAAAVKQVMEAFEIFDHGYAALAKHVFEDRHVDAFPRVGKTSGAYCMSVTPKITPYLFLNFANAPRDIYTIAHESGHAVHSQLASSHSMLTFHPTLVLAETASVFGEMLLFDKMMKEEKDAGVKKAVLIDKISGMYSTIGRQAHFVIFESDAHLAVGENATVDDLCSLYLQNLKGQFGRRVEVPASFQWEWTYIPHIYHTPFYCYAYAFGNLLSLALYERYREEGKEFVQKYLRLLSHGGSMSPKMILGEVGADMDSEGFWQGGFDVITRMVSELRRL